MIYNYVISKLENSYSKIEDKENTTKLENEKSVKQEESSKNNKLGNLQVVNPNIKLSSKIKCDEKNKALKERIPMLLAKKMGKNLNNKKKKDGSYFCDGEMHLSKGESIVKSWTFA